MVLLLHRRIDLSAAIGVKAQQIHKVIEASGRDATATTNPDCYHFCT